MANEVKKYNKTELDAMEHDAVRRIASDMGIRGMWRASKSDAIDAIITRQDRGGDPSGPTSTTSSRTTLSSRFNQTASAPTSAAPTGTPSKPNMISVSCGASSGEFPIEGKTVGATQEILTEVLNIAGNSNAFVNGKAVLDTYVVQAGDTVEFIKKAGVKG